MEVIEKPANGFEPVHETFTRNLMILKRVRKRLISETYPHQSSYLLGVISLKSVQKNDNEKRVTA